MGEPRRGAAEVSAGAVPAPRPTGGAACGARRRRLVLRRGQEPSLLPPSSAIAAEEKQQISDGVQKYSLRASWGRCDCLSAMWSSKYGAKGARDHQCKYRRVSELFGLGPQHTVLDWGAGCGHHLDLTAGRLGFRAIAVDAVEANVAWGRSRLKSVAAFCHTPLTSLPFPDGVFDAVFANAVLYHLPSGALQCQFLKHEVLRVLRPGGCAWIGTHGFNGIDLHAVPSGFFTRRGGCLRDVPGVVAASLDERRAFGIGFNWTRAVESHYPYSLILCKRVANSTPTYDGE